MIWVKSSAAGLPVVMMNVADVGRVRRPKREGGREASAEIRESNKEGGECERLK